MKRKISHRIIAFAVSLAFIVSAAGINTFIFADGADTFTVDGLTFKADDGAALVEGTDYSLITKTTSMDVVFDNAYALTSVNVNLVQIKTSRAITVSGSSSTRGIQIAPGTKANLTLAGVNITAKIPLDVATNMTGTANGAAATRGYQIINRTTLHLTVADGTTNTLASGTTSSYPGIHCGEGSELVIDDSRTNRTAEGVDIEPDHGRVPFDCTLVDGTVLKEGDPSWMMDSDNPGSLNVTGGNNSAGIGGMNTEESGKLTFNGGKIKSMPVGSTNAGNASGAGIGGGNGAGVGCSLAGSGITINGGELYAEGSYHGAAVGAGWSSSQTAIFDTGNAIRCAQTTNPIPGDITVNGGYTTVIGHDHGNGIGGACGSGANVGHSATASGSEQHGITINGGTLKPSTTSTGAFYAVGATGGRVVVTGGSFPLSAKSGGVNGLSINGNVTSSDGSSLTMVKIDVSAMEGIEVGYKINSFDVLVDNAPLAVSYGLADRVDSDQTLYFWLPSSSTGKSVTIENVTLMDNDGNIIKAGYPFSLPEVGKGEVTKRWVIFDVDTTVFSDELKALLYKKYDGLGWDYDILSNEIVSQNIEIPELPGAYITKADELAYSAVRTKDWQGNATGDSSSSGQISTTGTYRITVNYNEFINDPKVSNSFWGHQTTLESIISPAESRIINLNAVPEWQNDDHTMFKKITLTADVLPAAGEALTCAAPDGTVQFYINGVKVGKPVQVNAVTTAALDGDTVDYEGYNHSQAVLEIDFTKELAKYPIPELSDGTFQVEAQYLGGTNFSLAEKRATIVEDVPPEEFPFATPPTPTTGDGDDDKVVPDEFEIEDVPGEENPILHGYAKDSATAPVEPGKTKTVEEFKTMFSNRYGYINTSTGSSVTTDYESFEIKNADGETVEEIDMSEAAAYEIVATVFDTSNNYKTTITLAYNLVRVNIDTDGDGEPDVNVDKDGDGVPDINIDTDGDNEPDVNVDTNDDGKPDINIVDKDGDGEPDTGIEPDPDLKPDVNVDTDDDGEPDLNVDTDDDGKPDINIVDKDGDGEPDKDIDPENPPKPDVNVDTDDDKEPDLNVDTDDEGKPDINIVDKDGDGEPDKDIDPENPPKPDVNVDTDDDGEPDLNVDTDDDGKPDINIVDKDGDGKPDKDIDPENPPKPDVNIDNTDDGKPDVNVDTDGDGKPDVNIDDDGDGKPDRNIVDEDKDGKPDINIDPKKEPPVAPDVNIDTDGDGKPDVNIDTDGDGKPDLNVDDDNDGKPDINIVDKDGDGEPDKGIDPKNPPKPDVNVDTDGDGEPDLNVDTDDDGEPDVNIVDKDGDGEPDKDIDPKNPPKPDVNVDTDGDGKPDVNIDTDDDGKPDVNIVDKDGDGEPDKDIDNSDPENPVLPDVNVDTDGDNDPDVNIDDNGDGKPDRNIVDKDKDGEPDKGIDPKAEPSVTPDVNVDTDGDGKPDVNVDTDGDGKPDVNIDTDDDGKPDVNIVDKDGDGEPDKGIDNSDPENPVKPDVNVDTDGDGKPDVNVDTDDDGKPDVNVVDKDGDGKPDTDIDPENPPKPDVNVDTDGDGKPDVNIDTDDDGKPDVNVVDKDGDGKPDKDIDNTDPENPVKPDVNIDSDKDGKPDVNIDNDNDGKPDVNIDTTGNGEPDLNIDADGDGKPDVNVDTDNDGKPNINIDTTGNGVADTNIDTDGDGIADINVDTTGDGKADSNLDTDGDGVADTNIIGGNDHTADYDNAFIIIVMTVSLLGISLAVFAKRRSEKE